MAELTRSGALPGAVAGVGPETAEAGPIPVTDPRAVRARVAGESRTADDPTLRVSPVPEPLRMTNPSVGRGPLGGLAIAPDPEPGRVLAQRRVLLDGEAVAAAIHPQGNDRFVLQQEDQATRLVLGPERRGEGSARVREVLVDGFRILVETEPERVAALRERAGQGRASSAHSGPLQVKAIIPGKVVGVSVAPGDTVTAGQQLLVVEAMKMQNELRAPRDGTIDRVAVVVGGKIEIGDLLVVIS